MLRVSSLPWPLSIVLYSGGKSALVERGDVVAKILLIILDDKQIIRSLLLNNELCGVYLSMHRIRRYNPAFDIERFQ